MKVSSVTRNSTLHQDYSEDDRFSLLRQVAELYDPKVWPWAYDTWKKLNQKYFYSILKVGPIGFGLTEWGGCLGYFCPDTNKVIIHTSLIDPGSGAWGKRGLLGERMTEDVILHEMLHQSIQQRLGYTRDEKDQCHNFQPWCDEINRLNPMLGLEGKATIIKQRRIKAPGQTKGIGRVTWMPTGNGTLTRRQLSSWPHTLRPREYYERGLPGDVGPSYQST